MRPGPLMSARIALSPGSIHQASLLRPVSSQDEARPVWAAAEMGELVEHEAFLSKP